MGDSLSTAVARLRSSSARLNKLTDDAAELVRSVEDFLNDECSAGIEVFLPNNLSGCSNSFESDFEMNLAFRRVGKRYRIVLVSGTVGEPEEDWVTTPWSECSREIKLRALPHLPALVDQVARAIEDKVKEAETAIRGVTTWADFFNGKRG
jgi:hypothetical protein